MAPSGSPNWDTSRPVFVSEGEKAAACLAGIGAQAVGTVTGASGTPGTAPVAVLRGREVVLWPDADAAGTRHMERIAAALADVASSVRIYSPQGLPAGAALPCRHKTPTREAAQTAPPATPGGIDKCTSSSRGLRHRQPRPRQEAESLASFHLMRSYSAGNTTMRPAMTATRTKR